MPNLGKGLFKHCCSIACYWLDCSLLVAGREQHSISQKSTALRWWPQFFTGNLHFNGKQQQHPARRALNAAPTPCGCCERWGGALLQAQRVIGGNRKRNRAPCTAAHSNSNALQLQQRHTRSQTPVSAGSRQHKGNQHQHQAVA